MNLKRNEKQSNWVVIHILKSVETFSHTPSRVTHARVKGGIHRIKNLSMTCWMNGSSTQRSGSLTV